MGSLDVHLVFVSKHEVGSAEGHPGDWYMADVDEVDYRARHWLRLDGTRPGFEDVTIEAEEILQVKAPASLMLNITSSSLHNNPIKKCGLAAPALCACALSSIP